MHIVIPRATRKGSIQRNILKKGQIKQDKPEKNLPNRFRRKQEKRNRKQTKKKLLNGRLQLKHFKNWLKYKIYTH